MKKLISLLLVIGLAVIAIAQGNKPTIDYSAPANATFTAEEVTIPAKGYTLAGTLLLPKNAKRPLPVVLTITGSGQETRDEPVPFPHLEGYKPMRQIAETLAARGISGLGDMLRSHAERAPLGRNVDVAEVGSTGVFLASDASSGITGEVIYVDCGYNIMGF